MAAVFLSCVIAHAAIAVETPEIPLGSDAYLHWLKWPQQRIGVRAYNFELMLSWIAQVLLGRARHPYLPLPGRERALAGLLGLLDPAQKSDLSGGADFAPRLAEAGRISRKLASKLAHRPVNGTLRGSS